MSSYSVAEVSTRLNKSYFCCYVSLDSLRNFWRPAGRAVGTNREFATNACVCKFTPLEVEGTNFRRLSTTVLEQGGTW